jgi:hypothetical protein
MSRSISLVLTTVLIAAPAAGQPAARPGQSGEALYRAACAACHGADGAGLPKSVVGFDVPLADFTDCAFATREPDADWLAIAHQGGPVRAFDRWMPAFGEALAERDLQRILDYIRGFCSNRSWPRGELNLPRALVTEKAYPEDEAVLTTTFATGDAGAIGNELLYERRIGPRSQVELAVPLDLQQDGARGPWSRGLGDVAVAFKHALVHSLDTGTIFSAVGELVLPTGKESAGLGKGFTVLEPFVALGQILPADGFVQVQAGLELPVDRDRAGDEAFWRVVLGKSFTQGRFGRSWSPMVEFLGAREIEAGAPSVWDVVPQVQVTLSRRQHIMLNVGVRLPVNERSGRTTRVLTYLLWDWYDGGLFEGWR